MSLISDGSASKHASTHCLSLLINAATAVQLDSETEHRQEQQRFRYHFRRFIISFICCLYWFYCELTTNVPCLIGGLKWHGIPGCNSCRGVLSPGGEGWNNFCCQLILEDR